MIWQVLTIAAGLAAAAAAAVFLYILWQGEEKVAVSGRERTPLVFRGASASRAVFTLRLPVINSGRQDGIVLDAFARVLLPAEQFDLGRLSARLEREGFSRADDYMEAFIIRPGQRFELVMTLTLDAAGDIGRALDNMTDVNIDIYYQVVGRMAPRIAKCLLCLPLEEFRQYPAKVFEGGGGA